MKKSLFKHLAARGIQVLTFDPVNCKQEKYKPTFLIHSTVTGKIKVSLLEFEGILSLSLPSSKMILFIYYSLISRSHGCGGIWASVHWFADIPSQYFSQAEVWTLTESLQHLDYSFQMFCCGFVARFGIIVLLNQVPV